MLFFYENFEIVVEGGSKKGVGLVDVKTAARMSFSDNLWLYLWLGSSSGIVLLTDPSNFNFLQQIKG